MNDRQPNLPNRVKLTWEDGTTQYGYMERADEPIVEGTPLNKATLFNSSNSERYAVNLPSEAFDLIGKVWGTFTLTASGWSSSVNADGYYTQQIAVTGMKEKYYPSVIPSYASKDTTAEEKVVWGQMPPFKTIDGAIVAMIDEVPDISVSFVMVGV